jgi:hypothetical protein
VRQRLSGVLVLRLAVCGLLSTCVTSSADQVRLFIPAFESPGSLGLNVATVLNLQVWQTLRRAPTPNPKGLSFGDGLILWNDDPLDQPSHAAAERAGALNDVSADMILWGKAYAYGPGVVVQPHLTISDGNVARRARPEKWKLDIPTGDGGVTLTADVPARRYTFEPIVLRSDVVARYSAPAALKIYSAKEGGAELGTLGAQLFRARQHDGDRVLVVLNPGPAQVEGWVRLPSLSASRMEVVDFVGGLIRVMRTDWDGARTLIRRVLENTHTPTALRIDSLLYLGLLDEKQGRSGRVSIQQAYDLNRLAQSSATFMIMSAFADYGRVVSRGESAERRAAVVSEIRRLIDTQAFLFPEGDDWLAAARVALQRLQRTP